VFWIVMYATPTPALAGVARTHGSVTEIKALPRDEQALRRGAAATTPATNLAVSAKGAGGANSAGNANSPCRCRSTRPAGGSIDGGAGQRTARTSWAMRSGPAP
jgi:hypothetical protein